MGAEDRRAVMSAGAATQFAQGQTLFEAGDVVDRIHFVVSGALSLTMPMADGSAVEVLLIGQERAIGLIATHCPIRAFGRVRAETEGTAITVASSAFSALAEERPDLRRIAGEETASLAAEIAQGAACNAVHKLEPRLAKALLRFQDRAQRDELPLTQEHMSRMLGVSRTTLNAVAQGMQQKGVVRYTRGRLKVVDRDGLEALACACYQPPGVFREG
jgi:CRP-like cAMP-binding protein